ncbi:MAG: hypothetical protein MI806_26010 [Minwuiales bacterium]|nr:hypothetical protein [Minwuiales bacterium]
MAATDARPIPLKNVAYRVTFPIFDADGDLVPDAAGLDSEVSLDGAAFGDCTNEATQIAAASGMYFLDLLAAEMNADTVAIIIKSTTPGAKTTVIVLYPEEAGDIRVNVTQWAGGTATAEAVAGRPDVHMASLADGILTAAKFAVGAFNAVWAVANRTLSSGANIVLAKGFGVTGFNDVSAGTVKAQVVAAVSTDTYAEPGAVPAATSSFADKIGWLFALSRNKIVADNNQRALRNDADDANIATSAHSDVADTLNVQEWV